MKVFTILYDLPILINGKVARTLLGAKFPFSNFRYSTEEEKSLMIEEMEKLGKRYNPETFKIEDMTKEESVKKLEVGKDYINVYDSNIIVIDRCGDYPNKGFYGACYQSNISCYYFPEDWREATEAEVIEAFEKHLAIRYGEDWETMKIKERHPDSSLIINDGSWGIEIVKASEGWNVWNKNGLLYFNGIWVERLEEEPKIHIQDAIKENTVIHCETEEEAERILGMAHELGYKWCTGEGYKNNTKWGVEKSKTCYCLFTGSYASNDYYDYFKKNDYTIIPSTQIADLEETNPTGWSLSPEDVKEIKAGEKADNRYALKRDVLTILSVESKLNPDKKISEYLEQFKLILEVL